MLGRPEWVPAPILWALRHAVHMRVFPPSMRGLQGGEGGVDTSSKAEVGQGKLYHQHAAAIIMPGLAQYQKLCMPSWRPRAPAHAPLCVHMAALYGRFARFATGPRFALLVQGWCRALQRTRMIGMSDPGPRGMRG